MKIEYKESYSTKTKTHSLSQIVEAEAYRDSGSVETANSKASLSIKFTEELVEILYNKGILNDEDIGILVSKFCSCEEGEIKVKK